MAASREAMLSCVFLLLWADSGVYRCAVSVYIGQAPPTGTPAASQRSRGVNVSLRTKAVTVTAQAGLAPGPPLNRGHTFSLLCNISIATTGPAQAEVKWLVMPVREGEEEPGEGRLLALLRHDGTSRLYSNGSDVSVDRPAPSSYRLRIHRAGQEDQGLYRCQVEVWGMDQHGGWFNTGARSHSNTVRVYMYSLGNMLLEEEEREDQELEEVTEDWVTLMEMKIGKSLDAFQECIVKISRLCALLFDADPWRKTQDLDLPKGGIWRWWREAKLDAKMIVKIQELQPPSMEKLLKDESLGNKTSVELTNMVNDMKNILSCTKAHSIAFSHILKGIQNINAAFQQQSKDFREGKTSLGMLQVNDSQACSESLLEEVRRLREQKVMLEMQLVGLETRCSDTLLENNKLQETVELIRREADATSKPKLEIQTIPAVKKKRILQPEVREPDCWELRPVEVPGIEVEDAGPSVTQLEISPKKKLGKGGDIVAEVERLSRELLEDFQTNVIDLIQDLIEQDPVGKMWSTEAVNIYRSVEDTVRETLSKLLAKLHDAFANQIIQAPVPALELQHIPKFDRKMSRRAPEILQEVSSLFPMLDQNLDDVSAKFAVLDSLDPTTIQATSELRSVQSMGKEQICKMKAAQEGMAAMSNQERSKRPEVRKTREKTVKRYEAISEEQGEDEDRQASQGEQRQEERLSGRGREELKPKPKRTVKKKPKKLNEDILRYQTDMEVQQEHILRTKMARLPYGIDVKLQRTNLEVLSQALLRGDISLQMHALGTDLITQLQNADETRLLHLFKKYIAFCCIRRVR
ncbi:UNVERIFIED_CONTAM: hypothetical protein FKN15_012723 [Acipenser sinensis]